MEIFSYPRIPQGLGLESLKTDTEQLANSFQKVFSHALNNLQTLQDKSNDLTKSLAVGEINDLHQVMIAAEKASLSLQFVIQVRNKAIEAYQEVMRMQI